MRKPVNAICEQQKCRSACASAQSDQRLYCLLPGQYNTSTISRLGSLCSCASQFESQLVANTENRFSRDMAHYWAGEFGDLDLIFNVKRVYIYKHA